MTHQEALTCAVRLAGAGLAVGLRLTPRQEGTVWVEAEFPPTIDHLNRLRNQIRGVGYDTEFDGFSMNITGKKS